MTCPKAYISYKVHVLSCTSCFNNRFLCVHACVCMCVCVCVHVNVRVHVKMHVFNIVHVLYIYVVLHVRWNFLKSLGVVISFVDI